MLTAILLAIVIIILFVNMILSSIASYDVNEKDYNQSYKYSTWAAVTNGLALALVISILLIYYYRDSIKNML